MSSAKANALLLVAAMIWGISNVAQKTILVHMGPLTANGLKCLVAACVLAPFFWPQLRRRSLGQALGSGPGIRTIACFIAGSTAMQVGYVATTVINASLLVSTATIMTPAVAWLITGSRPAAIVWAAAAMSVVAIRLVGGSGLSGFGWGDALCLLAALCFAFWFVYLGQFLAEGGNPGAITVAQLVAAGIICCAGGLAWEEVAWDNLIAGLPELAVLGVLSSGVAYLLQAIAQKHTTACVAAVIVSSEAVFGALSGVAILGETLTFSTVAGIAVFLCAVILVQLPATVLRVTVPSR